MGNQNRATIRKCAATNEREEALVEKSWVDGNWNDTSWFSSNYWRDCS